MSFSGAYAGVYDAVHNSRNFSDDIKIAFEALCKVTIVNFSKFDVLDFGCGTGHHLNELAKMTKSSTGYDRSEAMIKIARSTFPGHEFTSDLNNLENRFDLVLSLFDVVSYQRDQEELRIFLSSISNCLKPGGYVTMDGWHSLGVRKSPPEIRKKILKVGDGEFLRTVLPKNSIASDSYALRIIVEDLSNNQVISDEMHEMKAWGFEDLEETANLCGMNTLLFSDRNHPQIQAEDDTYWRFITVLQKVE
jgi:SAM-dependent methyltransferase